MNEPGSLTLESWDQEFTGLDHFIFFIDLKWWPKKKMRRLQGSEQQLLLRSIKRQEFERCGQAIKGLFKFKCAKLTQCT